MLVHKHLIIRAEVNNPPKNAAWAEDWIVKFIGKIGMKLCAGPISAYVDVPGNRGLTVSAIIETSHIAMHVWDEPDPSLIQLDVYTCGPLDTSVVFNELLQFDPVKIEHKFLDREHGLTDIDI
jgi:S-adenosylmethionine/arginine decarboxylase-like enzyme